ncbi:hypothetical protein [Ochrobactrum sp. CGA5]|uniref:hypothetical protein n=1 Tax=Ochrobactrum sp. CGA5 TaxID=2583453 RepID=UPI00111E0F13|nr:hypothetical protein [Ochrobactrum sp. CGA5]
MTDLISALEELRDEVPVLKMAEANKSPTRRLMESVDLFKQLIDLKFRPSQVYAKVKDTDGIKEIRVASGMTDEAYKQHFASVYNAYKRDLRKKANRSVKAKPAPKVTAANAAPSKTSTSEIAMSTTPAPTSDVVEPTSEVPVAETKAEKKTEKPGTPALTTGGRVDRLANF